MNVPQYLPGEWIAVVARDAVALLPTATPSRTLRALWDSLSPTDGSSSAPGFVRHLQVLTDGLTSLPPFALLQVADGRLHAVVRGAVEVDVTVSGATRVLTAPHVSTWTEEVVDGVEAVAVRAPGVPGPLAEGGHPLVSGTVHAGAVRLPVAVPAPVGAPARPGRPVTARSGGTATATRALPVTTVVGVPSPALAADEPVEDTLLRPLPGEVASTSDVVDVVADAPADASADVPTDARADHDGTTVLSPDVVALRAQLPDWAGHALALPTASPAVAPRATSAARLVLSTGDTVVLDRPVLLGRAPQVSRVASAQVPRLLTVPSPLQDISRTHAEVRMDGDDVVLTDLRSTNGVLVVRPHAAPQRLQPGEATVLQPGVLVDLGEGVTFTVELDA